MITIKNIYFIINGIKFVVIYYNGNRQILKEVNNQLVQLSDEDKIIINNLFKYDDVHICKSERLITILNENSTIKNKESLYELFNLIESKIPESCREIFYRNLETLQINYNLDAISNGALDREYNSSYEAGSYDPITNTITISEEYVRNLWQTAQSHNDPQSFFNSEYVQTLAHEITHVASTSYNAETGVISTGFDVLDGNKNRNRGLTEGMTEVISMSTIPGTQEMRSGYYLEGCIANQLIQIIGSDAITDSYFSAQGIDSIKHRLQEYGLSEVEANNLFDQIEINYLLHEKYNDVPNYVLGSVQSTLLDCFEMRCRQIMNNPNFDREQIENMFNIYGYMLVTPYVLEQNGKNPNNYEGLLDNLERFRYLREQYITELDNQRSADINELGEVKVSIEQVLQQQDNATPQSHDEYRESLRNIYLKAKENDTVVHSQFNVIHGENPQCEHTVERINPDGRNIISQRTFDYNDDFRQQVLVPSVIDYAQCSPVMSSKVKEHVNQLEKGTQTADYQAVSENNNILRVNNIELQYATEISNTIQQITPVAYQQQRSQQMAMQQEIRGQQLGLSLGSYPSMNGFASTIILTAVVGIICLLIIILGVWILA